jgi:hypothetical protein
MPLPFALPDWWPGWAAAAVLVPLLLFALSFLLMPFNVFGLKGRLDQIEGRLDDIQGEIRALALRLPEPGEDEPRDATRVGRSPARPPIPPMQPIGRNRAQTPSYPDDDEEPSATPARRPRDLARRPEGFRPSAEQHAPQPSRTEPRLDWPR